MQTESLVAEGGDVPVVRCCRAVAVALARLLVAEFGKESIRTFFNNLHALLCHFVIGVNAATDAVPNSPTHRRGVCGDDGEIYDALEQLSKSPCLMVDYAENAVRVGIQNHNKQDIQNIFDEVIGRP